MDMLFFMRAQGRPLAAVLLPVIAALALALSSGQSFAAGMVEVDDKSYQREVAGSKLPVIVEFTAVWCGACRKAAPMMDEMAKELHGKVKVVKIDVDKARSTTARFKVNSIPAFFYMEDGDVKGQAIGALPKEALLKILGVPEKHWK